MIYNHKLTVLMMACIMATLVSGCVKMGAEQVGKPLKGNSPVQVAFDSMSNDFQDSVTNLSVIQRVNSGESPDKAVVTIEESGLQDDSIFAEKTIFSMDYQDGEWKIINRVKTQQCRPERGHQNFSEQPCH